MGWSLKSRSIELCGRGHTTALFLEQPLQHGMVLELWILQKNVGGFLPCFFQHGTIIGKAGQSQIRQTRLTGAQHLTWTAKTEVHFGNLKAIGGSHQNLQPLTRQGIATVIDQQTVRRRRAASDASSQLVELRKPKAIGVVDHHHTGLRHINTDFHNRGGDQHLRLSRSEAADHGLFVRTGQPTMQQTHLKIGEHLLRQLAMHLHRRSQIHLF